MKRTCDTCGCSHWPRGLMEYWDWTGKVRFEFCSAECRREASRVLGINFIDNFARDQRLRLGKII